MTAGTIDRLMALLGAAALGVVLSWPFVAGIEQPGDALIRDTIRLALAFYLAAALAMLRLRGSQWEARSGLGRLARWCWTWACVIFLTHVAMAFHYFHHWSHAHAVEHTRAVSGFGPGIYVSHTFSVVWTLDMLSWWLAPAWYAVRSPWVDRVLHAFMAFLIFNGTVVFEDGLIRWAGAAMFLVLAIAWLRHGFLGSR